MSKELAAKPSALALMASRLSVDTDKLLQTLKDTVFKGATNSELLALVVVSNEYGLNPLLREIYAFPAKGGGITPVVSIDGWINMVNRQPQLDGLAFEFDTDQDGKPVSCTCTIYIKNRSHPVRVTEFYSECFRATEPWKAMPRRMLRHKALKEAARVAFGFSGITDEDEANDIKPALARVISVKRPHFSTETASENLMSEGGETSRESETSSEDNQATVTGETSVAEPGPKQISTDRDATGDDLGWDKYDTWRGKDV